MQWTKLEGHPYISQERPLVLHLKSHVSYIKLVLLQHEKISQIKFFEQIMRKRLIY